MCLDQFVAFFLLLLSMLWKKPFQNFFRNSISPLTFLSTYGILFKESRSVTPAGNWSLRVWNQLSVLFLSGFKYKISLSFIKFCTDFLTILKRLFQKSPYRRHSLFSQNRAWHFRILLYTIVERSWAILVHLGYPRLR